MPVSTAHRLVAELVEWGGLERDADSRYRIGLRVWELGALAPRALGLREAALPIFEADRHAKKELKKRVRGVRPVERAVEGRDDPEAEAVRGYCAAVRSAITDDGRPPLAASGLKLADRLEAVVASLDRVAEKGG